MEQTTNPTVSNWRDSLIYFLIAAIALPSIIGSILSLLTNQMYAGVRSELVTFILQIIIAAIIFWIAIRLTRILLAPVLAAANTQKIIQQTLTLYGIYIVLNLIVSSATYGAYASLYAAGGLFNNVFLNSLVQQVVMGGLFYWLTSMSLNNSSTVSPTMNVNPTAKPIATTPVQSEQTNSSTSEQENL